MLRLVLGLVLTASGAAAQSSYSCSEWTKASLQHKGSISVLLDEEKLIWSNGKKIYSAEFISKGGTYASYFDAASLYMVYGSGLFASRWMPQGRDLHIRRIFFNSRDMQVSELLCGTLAD